MVKQIIWTNIQDTKQIDRLVKMADESDWWDSISEAERSSIERGLKDLDEGRFVDHSEARKLYEIYL
jgi:hypothetical protein